MDTLSFEQLPQAVTQLHEKLDMLIDSFGNGTTGRFPTLFIDNDDDQPLTASQAAVFLSLSIYTIYRLAEQRSLPHYKQGQRLYFIKRELIEWIKNGGKPTVQKLAEHALSLIQNTKRGGRHGE